MSEQDTQPQQRLTIGHAESGVIQVAIENMDTNNAESIGIPPHKIPDILYTMAGGERDEYDQLNAAQELAKLYNNEHGHGAAIVQIRSLLLALAIFEEEKAAAGEPIDVEIIDEIDDMSRDEVIALAKQLREASSPYAMARWAAANPDAVTYLTREPGTPSQPVPHLNEPAPERCQNC